MLGTGTQLDPYQITTVAEFRGMNDSTAYFKLMNDLDVNDSAWVTGWTEATMNFLELDGDGHEIRNINADLSGGALIVPATSTIKNITFANTMLRGTNTSLFTRGGTSNLTLDNVQVYLDFNLINDSNQGVINSRYLEMRINKCAFNLQGATTGNSIIRANSLVLGDLKNSLFLLDCTTSAGPLLGGLSSSKICVLGKIKITATTGTYEIFQRTPQQCYVACTVESAGATVKFSNTNPTSACFYDQELAGITMTAQTNVHALTTEQCKDKDYLNSIGFLVI